MPSPLRQALVDSVAASTEKILTICQWWFDFKEKNQMDW